ncbi:MAG: UDP-N-acetylglucosamine 2-epimerase [Spirochaetes bacterium]|nr:UDP-N-acetylglucosamine 2-epimerase [Spirochaetota bacterium]
MKRKILFVSQDQGSGNALYLVIKKLEKEENLSIKVFAAKQSKKIFRDHNISFTKIENTDFNRQLDFKPDLIMTGAGMRNSIEKEAILYGRNNQIITITLLDFWSHYWERFTIDGKNDVSSLPDYIFVMDNIAKDQMISEGFPKNKLVITGNPYFDTFKILHDKNENVRTDSILFISQPEYQKGCYQTDTRLFEDLLDTIHELDEKVKIIIRPHPKDIIETYTKYASENIIIDAKTDAKKLIDLNDIIIGKNSTLLFEAVFRGKFVISYQPTIEKPDRLVTNNMGLSYLVRSKSKLAKIIDNAIKNQLKTKKIGVIEFYNDGQCLERVTRNIKSILYGKIRF